MATVVTGQRRDLRLRFARSRAPSARARTDSGNLQDQGTGCRSTKSAQNGTVVFTTSSHAMRRASAAGGPISALERAAGIEPASSAWKAEVLPLHNARVAAGRYSDQTGSSRRHAESPSRPVYLVARRTCREARESRPADLRDATQPLKGAAVGFRAGVGGRFHAAHW
jgi:hypothetical protein